MARKFRQLICLAFFPALVVVGQESSPSPQPPASSQKPPVSAGAKSSPGQKAPDQFEDARRIFEKFSPEERAHFRENFQRWKDMPDQEKGAMRDREQMRREKIAKEIEDSIQKSGLQLDADRREVYALRYAQERRKIEDKLRREMETKRDALLQEVLGRLKVEFSSSSAAATSPSPSK
jgi:catalase